VRAGLSCRQGLLARANPAAPLGRRRHLRRQVQVVQVVQVDQADPLDRLGLRPLDWLDPRDRVVR
jgi:hypothetical protein